MLRRSFWRTVVGSGSTIPIGGARRDGVGEEEVRQVPFPLCFLAYNGAILCQASTGCQAHPPFIRAPVTRTPVFPFMPPTVRALPVSNNGLGKIKAVHPTVAGGI